MSTVKIQFRNPEEIVQFVNTVERHGIYACMRKGNFTVDAGSILGIIYLGLNTVIEVEVHTKNKENCERFTKEISQYVAA